MACNALGQWFSTGLPQHLRGCTVEVGKNIYIYQKYNESSTTDSTLTLAWEVISIFIPHQFDTQEHLSLLYPLDADRSHWHWNMINDFRLPSVKTGLQPLLYALRSTTVIEGEKFKHSLIVASHLKAMLPNTQTSNYKLNIYPWTTHVHINYLLANDKLGRIATISVINNMPGVMTNYFHMHHCYNLATVNITLSYKLVYCIHVGYVA